MGLICSACSSGPAITSRSEQNENYKTKKECFHQEKKRPAKTNRYVKKEEKLAHQLKKICDMHGKECNYLESASIFHKLGLLYQKRSPDMFSLIKCAALFNAALVRSSDNAEKVKNDLKDFCSLLLDVADAENKHADLVQYSNKVKTLIQEMRLEVSKSLSDLKLSNLSQINSGNPLNEKQLEELELLKISAIERIQDKLTFDYKNIMAMIAQYCEYVLGVAPCKFAIVGMGSLARKEITPYSDFEHVIILENIDESSERNEIVLNYFRWFSVIFHVIIINVQETILPAVAIFSLNDESSKFGNWFYDDFTTRGISFDGMMPHACKFPLGRQQFTETKKWKTELIKPISKMVRYLQSDESLKNGYHLSDILTKTCFVCGDANLYKEFETLVQEVLQTQEEKFVLDDVRNQIIDDLLKFSTRATLVNISFKRQIDIKKDIYRSTTLFVSALGRIYKICSSSCFEIINELAEQGEISSYAKRKLLYAVAMACELRLSWYMKNKSQCDMIKGDNPVNNLVAMVGKENMISYFQIAYALQCEVSKRFSLKKFHFYSDPKLLNLSLHYCLNNQISFLERLNKCRPNVEGLSQRFRNFDECLATLEKNEKVGQLSEKKAVNHNEMDDDHLKRLQMRHFRRLGDIFKCKNCFDDAVEFYTKAIELCPKSALVDEVVLKKQLHLKERNNQRGKPIVYGGAPYSKRYSSSNASTSLTVNEQLANMYFRKGVCLVRTCNLDEALNSLKCSLRLYRHLSIDVEADKYVALTLHEIARCFFYRKEFAEAIQHFEKSLLIKERVSIDVHADQSIGNTLHLMGCCFNKMKKFTEAEHCLRKSLEVDKRITHDACIDNNIATSLLDLGHCLVELKSFDEAKTCLENCLKIKLKIARDIESDIGLGNCYYELGHCMLAMKKFSQAEDYLKTSLQIYVNVSLNGEHDYHIANSFFELGVCFSQMKKMQQSLEYFEKSLTIRKCITVSERNDCDIANSWYGVARCYMQLRKYAKAKGYFEQSLAIYKQTSPDINTSNDIEIALRCINICDRCNAMPCKDSVFALVVDYWPSN